MKESTKLRLDALLLALKQLESTAKQAADTLQNQLLLKEKNLQEKWTAQRQVATIRQYEEDYEKLQETTTRLQQDRSKLKAYLQGLLVKTKALRQGVHSG